MRGVLTTSIGLVVGFVAAVAPAHADHPGATRAAASAPSGAFLDVPSLTKRVRDLHARLQGADSSRRAQIMAELLAAAQARASRLAALMEESPTDFLQAAMSAHERSQFPRSVQGHIEEEAVEDGEIEILHEDRWGSDRYLYALHTPQGRLTAHFTKVPNLLTGDLVRVRGVRLGQAVAANGGASGVELVSAALSNTFGEQKTIVIAVNFSNSTSPYTASTISQMQSVTFSGSTSASNYFREASYGETWLAGTVVGPFTIPMTTSGCDYYGISSQARAAATAAGVNLSLYRRYVYAFPANSCGWWGLGTIGGNPSQAWVNGSYQSGVVVHEMGHNLGLYHSHALDCGSAVLGGTCSSIEYGDTLDAMGGASPPFHFNAIQKELLGWLNYSGMPPIVTVQANGVYTIDPYETDGVNPKALKVRAPNGDWYYVEYRQPIGFDSVIHSSVRTGVVVHLWKSQSGDGVYLLDMTPQTSSWMDPALQVNSTYTDSSAGITISPLWANGSDAGVSISVGGGTTCVRANPTVTVSPAVKEGAAGSPVSYTVSITNRDSGCTAATYSGTASKPTGWVASFSAPSVTIAPGATASTTLQVTSATSASPGDYSINVTAASASAPSYAGSASATYGVQAPEGGGAAGGFSDGFDRPDASDLGAGWKAVSGDLFVQGNQAHNAAAMGLHTAVVDGLSGAAQSVGARFTPVDTNNGPRFGLLVRYKDAQNYYACYRQTGGSSNLRIVRVTNGIESILARVSLPNPKKGASFQLGCSAQGTALTLALDGAVKAAVSDATFASGGAGLLMGYPKSGKGGRSHSADDFTAQAD